jgi:hypothetical protein
VLTVFSNAGTDAPIQLIHQGEQLRDRLVEPLLVLQEGADGARGGGGEERAVEQALILYSIKCFEGEERKNRDGDEYNSREDSVSTGRGWAGRRGRRRRE